MDKGMNHSSVAWIRWLLVIAMVGVIASISWNPYKPIWLDEYLQFTLGAEPTMSSFWKQFWASGTLNLGQTGSSHFLCYLGLKYLGASYLSLRLQSLVGCCWLLFGSFCVFRSLGVSFLSAVVGLFFFLNNFSLMMFTSEARVYMLLTASVVSTLAYYLQEDQKRQQLRWKLFGAFSIVFGFFNHPYFVIYWGICVLFSAYFLKIDFKRILRFIHWKGVLPAMLLGALVGKLSWLRFFGKKWDLAPFQFMSDGRHPLRILLSEHIHGLGERKWPYVIIFVGCAYLSRKRFRLAHQHVSVALLIGLSLFASIFLSWMSYRSGYWILSRQWVASMALVTIALVYTLDQMGSVFYSRLAERFQLHRNYQTAFLLALLAISLPASIKQFESWRSDSRKESQAMTILGASLFQKYSDLELPGDVYRDQVALAHYNCLTGGPVFKSFRKYYEMKIKEQQ